MGGGREAAEVVVGGRGRYITPVLQSTGGVTWLKSGCEDVLEIEDTETARAAFGRDDGGPAPNPAPNQDCLFWCRGQSWARGQQTLSATEVGRKQEDLLMVLL